MHETDSSFAGSIPAIYDRLLVPLIFEDAAADLAARVAAAAPAEVLETAAGTGVLTRALASALPAGSRIAATDLNPAMLDIARKRATGAAEIAWSVADATALPFDDASFDAVACQFGAMFFPDRIAGYAEARRVLRPGGRFVFSMWDRIEANEFAHAVTLAAAEVFPDDPPRFLARTPHGHGDPDAIRAELAAAGFARTTIRAFDGTSRAACPADAAVAYAMGTPLRAEIEARDRSRLADVVAHAETAIRKRWGAGPIAARIRGFAIVASG